MINRRYFTDYLQAVPPYGHFATPTMIIHKDVLHEMGGFDTHLTTGMDRKMWFKIALSYPKIGYSIEPTAVVWKRQGSVTSTKQIDPTRKLNAIRANEEAARKFGPEGLRRAKPRLQIWYVNTLKASMLVGDKNTIKTILKYHRGYIPLLWHILAYTYLLNSQRSKQLIAILKRQWKSGFFRISMMRSS
jgi:hypothetical protein